MICNAAADSIVHPVNGIADQAALAEVASNPSVDEALRVDAIRQVEDPQVLAEIVKTDGNPMICNAAADSIVHPVNGIADQAALAEVASNPSVDEALRVDAIRQVEDPQVLAEIVKTDGNPMICNAAADSIVHPVNGIVDQAALAEVASNPSVDEVLRIDAIMQIEAPDVLAEIVKTDGNNSVIRDAAQEALDNLAGKDKWNFAGRFNNANYHAGAAEPVTGRFNNASYHAGAVEPVKNPFINRTIVPPLRYGV